MVRRGCGGVGGEAGLTQSRVHALAQEKWEVEPGSEKSLEVGME